MSDSQVLVDFSVNRKSVLHDRQEKFGIMVKSETGNITY